MPLPIAIPAAIAGAQVLSSILTNNANSRLANRAGRQSAAQAAQNRTFQERMSNTAYQRGMKDMRAAGLNPMLAFSKGGASVPTGAQGQSFQAKLENPTSAAISSALQARQLQQQIQSADANIKLTKAQAHTLDAKRPGEAANSQWEARKQKLKARALDDFTGSAKKTYHKMKDKKKRHFQENPSQRELIWRAR